MTLPKFSLCVQRICNEVTPQNEMCLPFQSEPSLEDIKAAAVFLCIVRATTGGGVASVTGYQASVKINPREKCTLTAVSGSIGFLSFFPSFSFFFFF